MKGFTLVEILVSMLILLGAVVFLIGTIVSVQKVMIFAKHKQQAVFLLEERIEEIKSTEWAVLKEGSEIEWYVDGTISKKIGPIEYVISPGRETATLTSDEWEGILDVYGGMEIIGGTFTLTCSWMEETGRWATVTMPTYIPLERPRESVNY
jgi:prepilin-type N-terminal cleavage/methylation domain-containing protein